MLLQMKGAVFAWDYHRELMLLRRMPRHTLWTRASDKLGLALQLT